MKIFIALLAVLVLANAAENAADKTTENAVQEETGEHMTSDYDNSPEEVSISEDTADVAEDETQETKNSDEEASKSDDETAEQVIRTQGLLISVRNGRIGISLTNGNTHANAVYTRWGRNTCRRGARLLYNGYAAGSHYSHKGDGADYLCMPKFPQYLSTTTPAHPGYIYGAEFETANRIFPGTTQNYNVPCAVCQVQKSTTMMIPAKVSCPRGWTREFYGYLMTSHYNHPRSGTHECVDYRPEVLPGTQRNIDGTLFYFVQTQCHGIPCRPYIANRATTCVICSA